MSFIIKTDCATSLAAHAAGDKHSHERHHAPLSQGPLHEAAAVCEVDELIHATHGSTSVRRAHGMQSYLSEKLSFLETQKAALECLQAILLADIASEDLQSSPTEFSSLYHELAGEKFNGTALFSKEPEEDLLYAESPESNDSVCIKRFHLDPKTEPLESLLEHVNNALDENRGEQEQILNLITTSHRAGHGDSPIPSIETIQKTIQSSTEEALHDPRKALAVQANANCALVWRLFE